MKIFTWAKENIAISIPIGGIILVMVASIIIAAVDPSNSSELFAIIIGAFVFFLGLGITLIVRENLKKFGR